MKIISLMILLLSLSVNASANLSTKLRCDVMYKMSRADSVLQKEVRSSRFIFTIKKSDVSGYIADEVNDPLGNGRIDSSGSFYVRSEDVELSFTRLSIYNRDYEFKGEFRGKYIPQVLVGFAQCW